MSTHPVRRSLLIAAAVLLACPPAAAQILPSALVLNASGSGNAYLTVANKIGLEGNSAYTIEAWIRPTSFAGFPTIVGNDFTTSYWLGLTSAGRLRFYPRGGSSQYVDSPDPLPLDQWTHVAAVYNSISGYTLYVNGDPVLAGSTILGAVGTQPGDLRIGADRQSGAPSYFWHGYLDEVRIWSVERSTAQIRATMHVKVGQPLWYGSGAYSGLRANWPVQGYTLTGSTMDAADVGEGENDAVFVNGDENTLTTPPGGIAAPMAPNVGLALNGIDDHAVLGVSENFGRGLTLMAWIAPTTTGGYRTIIGRDYASSFWLGLTPDGHLRFYPTGGVGIYFDSNATIGIGSWTHVAATFANGRVVLYVNGQADRIVTGVAGPVGANGRTVWLGADNEPGGLAYPFTGYLDAIRVVQGSLDRTSLRAEMYRSHPLTLPPIAVPDAEGVSVSLYKVDFDHDLLTLPVPGSNARLVRSGAPMVDDYSLLGAWPLAGYGIVPFSLADLPDNLGASSVRQALDWPDVGAVGTMEVFVVGTASDLSQTRVTLESPSGKLVNLVAYGDATGRDLVVMFHDSAPVSIASVPTPYFGFVRPSTPLSTFVGEPSAGRWWLTMETGLSSPERVGLWACGIRINVRDLSVTGSAAAEPSLRLAGANPVRSSGALAFDLPHEAGVDLALLDLQGRRVRTILSGPWPAGLCQVGFAAGGLAPGTYFARLLVDGREASRVKLTIVH